MSAGGWPAPTKTCSLARLTGLIDKLVVHPENMKGNLDRLGGLIFSQGVLLALTQAGMDREKAYQVVQRNAEDLREKDGDFRERLAADQDVTRHLDALPLAGLFDLSHHARHVETIFRRVFGEA